MDNRLVKDLATQHLKVGDAEITLDMYKFSAMLRIADAMEAMNKNYTGLIEGARKYYDWYKDERERTAKLEKQISALKGVITKLKNKEKNLR